MVNNVDMGTIGNAHGSGLGLDVIAHERSHFIDPRGPTCNAEQPDCISKKKYGPVDAEADMSKESLGFSNFVYRANCTFAELITPLLEGNAPRRGPDKEHRGRHRRAPSRVGALSLRRSAEE